MRCKSAVKKCGRGTQKKSYPKTRVICRNRVARYFFKLIFMISECFLLGGRTIFKWPKINQNSITLQWNALSSGQSVIRFLARQTKKQQKQSTFKFHKSCCVKLFWFNYLSMFFNYHNLKKNPFYLGQNFQMKILTFDLLNYYFCHPLIKTDDLGWQSIFFLRFKTNFKS